ncbi:exportin 1 [Trypanosoma brucei brucei TREU927]|uniref:Exportin 1 n=1 Tax=Trypanosoma brucei brucei (strain 927/4 GUTat10.1) TaxID=185431 RepID=Q382A3_TRYB2|nr:exportin 1 [Trypanosoma brucei brucei TREU927]EAN80378.1 exportin 1 [Trypanosoma brucei brucei TREU927]
MEDILDFSKPVDVQRFDQVVQYLSTGSPQEIVRAQEVLTAFKERPDSFLRVGDLLTKSVNLTTRFFALQVLEDAILHRWNTFTAEQCQEIRNFVVNMIVGECVSFNQIRSRRALLMKMNSALVSIAKREWPVRWPTFIKDVCSSAGPDEPLVENNLNILRMVGEEIFEFSEKTLTTRWLKRKKEALQSDFQAILQLCLSILSTSDEALLKTNLECLEKYLSWVEPASVFNEELLKYLAGLIARKSAVSRCAVRCLTVACSVETDHGSVGDAQAQVMVRVFRTILDNIMNLLPTNHSSVEARIVQFSNMEGSVDAGFVGDLNLLLVAFLKHYTRNIMYDDLLLISANQLIVGMSHINDKELFKSCVDYWWWLGEKMVRSASPTPLHRKLALVLSNVRFTLIKKMARPEEVIIVVEDGEVRRVHMKDVEELQLYKLMRETLVFLTYLDPQDMQAIMTKIVMKLEDLSEWSWHNCNTLSWAVGAISVALTEEQESSLFVVIVRGLLDLCSKLQGKENRAVVASGIMFVVGQYPRFLRAHQPFFRAVVKKVIEFMCDLFPGVQEMAVDTLLKVASQVPDQFVCVKNNGISLAEETAKRWTEITSLLKPQHMHTCFVAAGWMVKGEKPERQPSLLGMFLQDANDSFRIIVERAASKGPAFGEDFSGMGELIHILRVFSSIASSCGTSFVNEMGIIIYDLQGLYRTFFSAQTALVADHGTDAMERQEARYLRLAKREILRIFECFVDNTEECDFVATNCMPSILTTVLEDYRDSLPIVKEAGALALVTACVNKLGTRLAGDCAAILDHTFDTTISMICANAEDFPEFRVNLFKLLHALNTRCFSNFLSYASTKGDVINGMLWVIKHTDFAIMETGLKTLDAFLENVSRSELLQPFYDAFMQQIFVEVLVSAMDSLHAAGFELHCSILIKLFTVSSMFPVDLPKLGRNDIESFLCENLSTIATLTPVLIKQFIAGAYEKYGDPVEFRRSFADFLIEMQVWGAEEENRLQQEEEQRRREEDIPGFAALSVKGPPPTPSFYP